MSPMIEPCGDRSRASMFLDVEGAGQLEGGIEKRGVNCLP